MKKEGDSKQFIELFAGTPIEAGMLQRILTELKIKSFLWKEYTERLALSRQPADEVSAVKVVIRESDYENANKVVQKFRAKAY